MLYEKDLTLSHKNTMQQIDQTNADLVKKYRTLRAESQKIQSGMHTEISAFILLHSFDASHTEEEKQRQQLREVEMTIAQLKVCSISLSQFLSNNSVNRKRKTSFPSSLKQLAECCSETCNRSMLCAHVCLARPHVCFSFHFSFTSP